MRPGNLPLKHLSVIRVMNTLSPDLAKFVNRAAPHARALMLLSGLAVFAGCASEPDSHVVSAPPPPAPNAMVSQPVTVTTQSTTTGPVTTTQTQPVSTVVVTQVPPALQSEVVLARPSPDYVWVAGYWTWQDNRYEWVSGQWVIPPHSNSAWVSPHWEPENGGYRFYEGYWN
jgi:WXXGXW repeat (2 copies)